MTEQADRLLDSSYIVQLQVLQETCARLAQESKPMFLDRKLHGREHCQDERNELRPLYAHPAENFR